MKKAITVLTRGYSDLKKYDDLINRNIAIQQHINQDCAIPLIIFHEGNITPAQQEHIKYFANGQTLRFIDIADIWAGGYEGMCKFNIYQIFELTQDFDVVMRIDEDCIITKSEVNPFDQIGDAVFLNSVYWAESHSETNATLPHYIQGFLGLYDMSFYNDKFPYTNVCLFRPSYFMSEPVYSLIKHLGDSPLQRANRWGDLPVLGSVLNIFQPKVNQLNGFEYYHKSHDVIVKCGI